MIKDEFTNKKYTRQRKYQLRHQKTGLCLRCAEKAVTGNHCLKHAIDARERQRKFKGCKKRIRSLTYELEYKKNGKHQPSGLLDNAGKVEEKPA